MVARAARVTYYWNCDSCRKDVHPYSQYVVVRYSWDAAATAYICVDCWVLFLEGIAEVIAVPLLADRERLPGQP